MNDNESKASWSFIDAVLKHLIFPYITAGIAPFLPSKYSLRTFMVGILIIAIYWAYQFNKYYKQCDTNKNSIKDHADTINKHDKLIRNNKNEIKNLKDQIKVEREERRNDDNLTNSSEIATLLKEYNQTSSDTSL